MDVLSDVLSTVRLTGALFFDIDAGEPWVGESPGTAELAPAIMPDAGHIIAFHVVLRGGCWANVVDAAGPPVWLNAGDVVVFPGGAPNVLSSSPGARGPRNPLAMYYVPLDQHLPFELIAGGDSPHRTRFVCGFLGCDVRPFNPLLSALPPMLSISPSPGVLAVTELLTMALAEGRGARAGSETVLAKLSELMFVEVVRRYIEEIPADARGWLAGLKDPHISAVLRLIHARPAEPWTLDGLSRAAGMSRSVLADRFAGQMGVSPMQYLARWRMHLAARRLEDPQVSIGQAAAEVGYESEAAFSRAFKKLVGAPPGTWRRNGRHKPDGHNFLAERVDERL